MSATTVRAVVNATFASSANRGPKGDVVLRDFRAMPIPEFTNHPDAAYDYLPPGKYVASISQIRERFVDPYGPDSRRAEIFNGWLSFRQIIHATVTVSGEYLDGSFVTSKEEPSDLDLSMWIDADRLDGLEDYQAQLLINLVGPANRSMVKATFHCDPFLVPECALGHSSFAAFQHMLWTETYWASCRQSDGSLLPGVEKGFIRVAL